MSKYNPSLPSWECWGLGGGVMEDLEAKVDSEEYDVVVVSETWFK